MSHNDVPQQEIRRFDIFAEWNRLKANKKLHLSASASRAYGLAVAKIVAARKFSGHEPSQVKDWKQRAKADNTEEAWWEHLGSEKEFLSKVVQRMGETFYQNIFQPEVLKAWNEGKKYEEIRDTLRASWNKALPKPSKQN